MELLSQYVEALYQGQDEAFPSLSFCSSPVNPEQLNTSWLISLRTRQSHSTLRQDFCGRQLPMNSTLSWQDGANNGLVLDTFQLNVKVGGLSF